MRLFLVSAGIGSLAAAGLVLLGTAKTLETPSLTTESVHQEFAIEEAEEAAEPELAFDLLRLEPDGSLLIAGRGTPDSEVEIVSGNDVIGQVRTGATGDFVYSYGGEAKRYELRLRSGAQTSTQVALVDPATDDAETLTLITEPDDAARIGAEKQDVAPVAVEAVEVEGRELLVAGRSSQPGKVRIYLDNDFVGETEAGNGGRFLLRSERPIEDGRYDVRVDLVAPADGAVLARAQVPLVHGTGPAAMLEDDPAALRTGASIIIRRGDSLWRISRRAYGRGTRYTTIFEANREQILDPDRIFAGQVFKLPSGSDG